MKKEKKLTNEEAQIIVRELWEFAEWLYHHIGILYDIDTINGGSYYKRGYRGDIKGISPIVGFLR